MSVEKLLEFLAPSIEATPEDIADAIALAESYRPACLLDELQDEAQALYAAWLLSLNQQQRETVIVPVGVTSEKEGDLARSYGAASTTIDPLGFKARYDLLADRCKVGNARLYRGACVK